jgi:hypothetical protein
MLVGRKARSIAGAALATISACAALAGTANGAVPRDFFGVVQAQFLKRTYRKLIASRFRLGLERVVWHTWQDAQPGTPWTLHMGLIRSDESAKPSLAAYARLPR